jgi:hypothetical protein
VAGTNAHAAKLALRDLIDAAAAFDGVQVEYGYPGLSTVMRECVYFGDVEGPVALSTMRGGQALKREEDLQTTLHIDIQAPGTTIEDTEQRACVLGAAFEAVIGANPTLGDLANLKLARIDSFSMSSYTDDEFTHTRVAYGLTFKSINT